MPDQDRDPPDDLSPRERARLRHRDRKRSTPMVVDNAGVRRTELARARRLAEQRESPPEPR